MFFGIIVLLARKKGFMDVCGSCRLDAALVIGWSSNWRVGLASVKNRIALDDDVYVLEGY